MFKKTHKGIQTFFSNCYEFTAIQKTTIPIPGKNARKRVYPEVAYPGEVTLNDKLHLEILSIVHKLSSEQ